jgi:16S rRNA processing protein RimM
MAVVGRIARAHGLHGQVIVNLETDFPRERFKPGAELFVKRSSGVVEPLVIATARFQHDRPVIGLSGVDDVNAATAMAGLELRVPTDRLAPLPDGMFYRHDLIGCVVETADRTRVGIVTGVEGSMGGSRLVIAAARGDVLVPLAAEICRSIDPAGKRIVITPPDGLLELNERV